MTGFVFKLEGSHKKIDDIRSAWSYYTKSNGHNVCVPSLTSPWKNPAMKGVKKCGQKERKKWRKTEKY